MPDPSYEILPQRGRCVLSNGDDEYKDKYNDEDRKKFQEEWVNVYRFKFPMLMYIC